MNLRSLLIGAIALLLPLVGADKPQKPLPKGKWVKMFDGKSLKNWQANQNPDAWTVVKDGKFKVLKGSGKVSHLFWMREQCEDCEFKADVKIGDGANSGMYFRTAMGPGFPKGYEAQVNATHSDPVKTGSLYSFAKNLKSPTKPDEWFTQHIIVQGTHVIIKVNDQVITDYDETKKTFTKGYLALQQHDPKSVVEYKNLMYKKL